jgi:hypothetical protein
MIEFGIPKASREARTEKFPGLPVITVEKHDDQKRTTRVFRINTAANDLLELPEDDRYITYGFKNGNIYVGNADEFKTDVKIRVNKNVDLKTKEYHFFSKELYEYIDEKIQPIDEDIHWTLNPCEESEQLWILGPMEDFDAEEVVEQAASIFDAQDDNWD